MKSKVLVVDDEQDFLELLKYNLTHQGFEVITAASGCEALLQARCAVPDVILLDLMLPDIDGISVCETLRSNPRTARVPVVMVSQLDNAITRHRGREAGVTRYFSKSIDLGDLKDCIRSLAS